MADPSIVAAAAGIIGVLVGGAGNLGVAVVHERWQRQRDREAHARRELDRRRGLGRELYEQLIGLQEGATKVMEAGATEEMWSTWFALMRDASRAGAVVGELGDAQLSQGWMSLAQHYGELPSRLQPLLVSLDESSGRALFDVERFAVISEAHDQLRHPVRSRIDQLMQVYPPVPSDP